MIEFEDARIAYKDKAVLDDVSLTFGTMSFSSLSVPADVERQPY